MSHIAYSFERYADAEDCLRALREHLGLGWTVSSVRGAGAGPYLVVFRKEEAS